MTKTHIFIWFLFVFFQFLVNFGINLNFFMYSTKLMIFMHFVFEFNYYIKIIQIFSFFKQIHNTVWYHQIFEQPLFFILCINYIGSIILLYVKILFSRLYVTISIVCLRNISFNLCTRFWGFCVVILVATVRKIHWPLLLQKKSFCQISLYGNNILLSVSL